MDQKPQLKKINSTPAIQQNDAELYDNPYKILVETIKNPFELEEIDRQYKIAESQQRQQLSKEVQADEYRTDKLPSFFKTEKRILVLKLLISLALLIASIGGLGYILYANLHHFPWFSNGYYALVATVFIPSISLLFFYSVKIHFLRKEIQIARKKFNPNQVSNVIQRIYKRLLTSFSNINWLAAYIYLTAAFILLVIFIVSYFASVYYLGGINAPKFGTLDWQAVAQHFMQANPKIVIPSQYPTLCKTCVIVIGSTCGATLLLQIGLQLTNYVRIRKIESTYTTPILTQQEQLAIKKSVNKRNLIIFCVLTLIFGIILLVLYLVLKRKK